MGTYNFFQALLCKSEKIIKLRAETLLKINKL